MRSGAVFMRSAKKKEHGTAIRFERSPLCHEFRGNRKIAVKDIAHDENRMIGTRIGYRAQKSGRQGKKENTSWRERVRPFALPFSGALPETFCRTDKGFRQTASSTVSGFCRLDGQGREELAVCVRSGRKKMACCKKTSVAMRPLIAISGLSKHLCHSQPVNTKQLFCISQ